jgi:hypothetical protein
MGRWLDALKDITKISMDAPRRTDKTDETPAQEVLSVLSVGGGPPHENFRGQNVAGGIGSVSFVSALPGVHPEFTLAEPDVKFSMDARDQTDKTDKTFPDYPETLAGIIASGCPENIPAERWHQFVDDAGLFLDLWGSEAERLGWTSADLFGLDPVKPMQRYDRQGVVWMLKGEAVIELTANAARLSGGLTFYRRLP